MADVVRYWRAVEYFTPQRLEEPSPRNGVCAVTSTQPLPWESTTAKRDRRGSDQRHTVYLGVFDLRRVAQSLRKSLGSPAQDPDDGRIRRQSGWSALASLTLDGEGRYIKDSLALSTCGWAVGHVRRLKNDDWFTLFDDAQNTLEMVASGIGYGVVTPRRAGADGGARVAGIAGWTLAAVTGGVSTIVPVLVSAAAPWINHLGALLLEKVGGALSDKANDAIRQKATRDATGAEAGRQPRDVGTHPFTRDDLTALTEWAAQALDVTGALEPNRIWVRSSTVRAGSEPPSTDMLKSFQADDLADVATALRRGDVGRALRDYLTADDDVDTEGRADVRATPRLVLDGLGPLSVPAGGWPGRHNLVASQQFAVNQAFHDLAAPGGRGLRAVNGPPGTGKSTLLKDIVAGVVVERARVLATLPTARAAFGTPALRWKTKEGRDRVIRPLLPALTGYEMVVASSNNTAVENVSRDLPRSSAVDVDQFSATNYFAEQAQLLSGEPDSWGMVAAVLGKREHRRRFVDAYWARGSDDDQRVGLHERLKAARRPDGTTVSWQDAVAAFDAASERVERLRSARGACADNVVRPDRPVATAGALAQDVVEARSRLQAARTVLQRATVAAQGAHDERSGADRDVDAAVAALESCRSARPGWLHRVFRRDDYVSWHERLVSRETDLDEMRTRRTRALEREGRAAAAENEARRSEESVGVEVDIVEQRAAAYEQAVATWGDAVPGPEWDATCADRAAMERRERSAPWSDPEFTRARADLFLAALDLHEALLVEGSDVVRRNLAATMDVVNGNVPHDVPARHIRAAWQMLFLAVPVVSTTFDSLPRMFDRLGREDLGWLIVDEAGQVPPQQAVGALWRARRAIVVGDPLQIEPVVTVDLDVQNLLRKHFAVDAAWMPARRSAQATADRVTPLGTYLPFGEDDVWVGLPLRVHRRCDDPMFTISNTIAYDRSMVDGVGERPPARLLRQNTWIDVPAGPDRWNPLDGQWAASLLRQIDKRGREELSSGTRDSWDLRENVFVISPYKSVADQLRRSLAAWLPMDKVGTIHTAQGQEAEVVILVLGGSVTDLSREVWAARTPNVLNVAVSRARRQLAVIGDLGRWSKQRHFSVLAGCVGDEPRAIKRVDGTAPPRW